MRCPADTRWWGSWRWSGWCLCWRWRILWWWWWGRGGRCSRRSFRCQVCVIHPRSRAPALPRWRRPRRCCRGDQGRSRRTGRRRRRVWAARGWCRKGLPRGWLRLRGRSCRVLWNLRDRLRACGSRTWTPGRVWPVGWADVFLCWGP